MSEPLVDPLKVRTWGVKRPLDEKMPEIQQELQEGKRYYPESSNHKMDEWGAILRHREEMAQVQDAQKRITDEKQKEELNTYLTKDIENRRRQFALDAVAGKHEERLAADQKKQEQIMMEEQAKNMEKERQHLLSNNYLNTMQSHQQKEMQQRAEELMKGKQADEKALFEDKFFKQAEKDKKNMIKNILSSGYSYQDGPASNVNLQGTNMSEGDRINLETKLDLDNRLRKFNNFTTKTYSNYQSNVLTPAQMKLKIQEELTQKQHQQQMREQEVKEIQRENNLRHQNQINGLQVKNQIVELESAQEREKQAQLEIEMRQSMEAEMKFKAEQEALAEKKR